MFKWYQIKLRRSYPFNRSLALFLAGLYPSSFVFSHFLPKIQFRLTFSLFLIFCQNQGFYSYKPFNDMNIPSISTISANVREVHMFKIFLKTNRLHWASWYEKQLVEMFCKQVVCKSFAKLNGKHLLGSLFWLEKDSDTVVFMWILRNNEKHLYYRTPPLDCFWGVFRQSMIMNNSCNISSIFSIERLTKTLVKESSVSFVFSISGFCHHDLYFIEITVIYLICIFLDAKI